MRPLTDHTPKPLLEVAAKPLLQHHIEGLVVAGFRQLVVNVSYLGQQIIDFCGDGSRWDVSIVISREEQPLETAGGIVNALPLLGDKPFLVLNGDVWCDYPFGQLRSCRPAAAGAHLVMVDNPSQHPLGDFSLQESGLLAQRPEGVAGLTYAGIGVYQKDFFAGIDAGKAPLRPLLDRAIAAQCLSAQRYRGEWVDVGTPQRLAQLQQALDT